MPLGCSIPRLEAGLADGPLLAPCPAGHDLVFAPGWYCDDCRCCVFPDLVRDSDDEPDACG
jgi:hypothetical protein